MPAIPAPAPSGFVFFGDSLSDDGNLYDAGAGILPDEVRDAISGEGGRISNGPVWAEYVAELTGVTDYFNYAVADAEAIGVRTLRDLVIDYGFEDDILVPLTDPALDFDINLGGQIDRFLEDFSETDISDLTGIIMIGGNDFLEIDPFESGFSIRGVLDLLDGIVDSALQAAVDLAQAGIGSVVICAMPTSEFFPAVASETEFMVMLYDVLVDTYNEALQDGMDALQGSYSISYLNMNAISEAIAEDPEGFGLIAPYTDTLTDDDTSGFDDDQVAFWDSIHPTTATHAIMGAYAAAVLEGAYTFTDDDVGSFVTFSSSDGVGYVVLGNGGKDVYLMSENDDTVIGGTGNDLLVGRGGADILDGGSDDDLLLGGAGDDILDGSGGNDIVVGGAGADVLVDGTGDDILSGGADDDTFIYVQSDLIGGGPSNDLLDGGDGTDTLYLVLDSATAADYSTDAAGTLAALGLSVTNIETIVVLEGRDGLSTLSAEDWFTDADVWGIL